MNLKQIQGNTWVIEANALIPIYILPDRRCILLHFQFSGRIRDVPYRKGTELLQVRGGPLR